jgi:hypothetical protein
MHNVEICLFAILSHPVPAAGFEPPIPGLLFGLCHYAIGAHTRGTLIVIVRSLIKV